MTVTVVVIGIANVDRKLSAAVADSTLRPPMQKAVTDIHRAMARYPPPPPNSAYVRTGLLGRLWTESISGYGANIWGRVGNATPYGPWVQMEAQQARIHRGRWQTDVQIAKQYVPQIEKEFQAAVAAALAR